MSETTTASATSLNFVGFDDMAKNGTLLFNQIYIARDPGHRRQVDTPPPGSCPGSRAT